GNDAADGGGNDLADVAETFGPELFGEGTTELFRLRRMLEDLGLLQEDGRAQAGREDEMPLEERAAVAEDLKNVVGGHAGSFAGSVSIQSILDRALASGTVARRTSDRPWVSLRVDITSVSW